MKIAVDQDKCIASGACVLAAPDLFDQDDDGIVLVLKDEIVEPAETGMAQRAARACPALVITLD